MDQVRAAHWEKFFSGVLLLLSMSCSGNIDVTHRPAPTGVANAALPDIARKPGADNTPDPAEAIAGQFLARVNITATHSVEFWELQPGNVLTVQAFHSGAGDQRLELADMLRAAGGHYGGLYRALLHDEHASIPGLLVDADEHRRSLPIRDARVPLPPLPTPLDEPGTGEAVAGGAPSAQPGALTTLGLHHSGTLPNSSAGNGIDPTFCPWPLADSFCPAGYYRYFYGRIQETIYWDAIGSNASGSAGATMVVNQSVNNVWTQKLSYALSPGTSVEAWAGANPNVYQGRLTGTIVAYAERVRLSFPSLSEANRHPDGVQQPFVNGLNGITHRSDGWIMSRTQGPSVPFTDYYGNERGCLAWFSFADDLAGAGADRCPGITSLAFRTPPHLSTTYCCTPSCCYTANNNCPPPAQPTTYTCYNDPAPVFNHFGDLVYQPAYTPELGAEHQGDLVYVSMNMTGATNGSVGVLTSDLSTPLGYAVLYPNAQAGYTNDQVAWVAWDQRTHEFYTSNSSGIIARWNIDLVSPQPIPDIVPATGVASNGAQATWLGEITPLNVNGSRPWGDINIQGAKVSSHGKLWLWTGGEDDPHTLLGLDPYSGMIQCSYGPLTDYREAEGLDITEPWEGISSPGVAGSIHLQQLSEPDILSALTTASAAGTWQMVNLDVSDAARL